MKRTVLGLISLLSLLLVAGSAFAQTIHVRADIPFSFTVGSKTLPAGAYDLATLGARDDRALLMQARDGTSSTLVISNAAENVKPAEKTKLVFDRCGSQYFLSEIWVEGGTHGRRLLENSREKELAREMAQDRNRQRVEIVASLY